MANFNNLKTAFSDKSDSDLNKVYLLFKTIRNPFISKLLTKIIKVAIWLHLPIKNIIKSTIYKHFCGGETIKESQNTINKLWQSNIGTILDFSAEGKESVKDFNLALEQTLSSIRKAKNEENIPFAVFKPTGLCKFSLLEKMSRNNKLNLLDSKEKVKFESRINKICKLAYEMNVCVFIDAEKSWIQNAIDNITEEMMEKYNTEKALIFHTIQLYRNDRIRYLNLLLAKAKKQNFYVGLKLVRGAYHEQEIERAKIMHYTCPVHILKNKTDNDYNLALRICIQNIDFVSVCAGTHNEKSSQLLTNLLKEHKISNDDERVYFSQLLGMSDHISYNLAKEKYNVSKYVPYGPLKDVIPYLIRRLEENTSITGQIGRELSNIIAEKKRRKNN